MPESLQLLDCTLRDGGLGLEDAFEKGICDVRFSPADYRAMIDCLASSRLDIVELGSIQITSDDRRGFGIYPDVQSLSRVLPADPTPGKMYVGLYRGPDTPLEDIPPHASGLVDGLRVILRYSELQKSLDFCAALAEKGYRVFVQPMLTMRYTDAELAHIIDAANRMGAYALYFVDSYGYMTPADVSRFYHYYNERLDPAIRIGFHAHNNINMAYANARHFREMSVDRPCILDACAIGMGQGAGNLQTELISFDFGARYDYAKILDLCEIVERYTPQPAWGYSVTRLLPALHHTAYKFAVVLRSRYHFTFAQIDAFLREMPAEDRFRYTEQALVSILRKQGYDA